MSAIRVFLCALCIATALGTSVIPATSSSDRVKFIVVAGNDVIGAYAYIHDAKKVLNRWRPGAPAPSRAIFELKNGDVGKDPTKIDGHDQGAGVSAGFNKWWWNWNDIRRMHKIAAHFIDTITDTTVFIVTTSAGVVGVSSNIEEAKKMLLRWPPGATSPQRAVFESKNGDVIHDPHTVGGQNQGAGLAAGFNKWWFNWNAIHILRKIVQAYVDTHKEGSDFIVVVGSKAVGTFLTLAEAKKVLLLWPHNPSPPSRVIFEVDDGDVRKDPHKVGGEDQGAGLAAGFNKFWYNWDDIHAMHRVAEAFFNRADADVCNFIMVVATVTVGCYRDLEWAKKILFLWPAIPRAPSRVIFEVKDNQVLEDPHKVAGQNQGAGLDAGFNKFWLDWGDINRMCAIARSFFSEYYGPY